MATDPARRMDALCRQLTENVMSAALCVDEIATIAHEFLGDHARAPTPEGIGRCGAPVASRPLEDESTLSVSWRGRTLRLGHTRGY